MQVSVLHPRCPFCHEEVIPGAGPQIGCHACHAWQHTACYIEHQKCAACGITIGLSGIQGISGPQISAAQLTSGIQGITGPQISAAQSKPAITDTEFKWDGEKTLAKQEEIAVEFNRRITSYPEYRQVWEIVTKNCDGPVRLVGGRVYRTLLEIIHDISFDADKCDWDWVTTKFGKLTIPETYAATAVSLTMYDSPIEHAVPTIATSKENGLRRFSPIDTSNIQLLKKPAQQLAQKVDIFVLDQMNAVPRKWGGWGPKVSVTLDDYHEFVPFGFQKGSWDPATQKLHDQWGSRGLGSTRGSGWVTSTLQGLKLDMGHYHTDSNYKFIPIWVNNENAVTTAAKFQGISRLDYIEQKTGWLHRIKIPVGPESRSQHAKI